MKRDIVIFLVTLVLACAAGVALAQMPGLGRGGSVLLGLGIGGVASLLMVLALEKWGEHGRTQ